MIRSELLTLVALALATPAMPAQAPAKLGSTPVPSAKQLEEERQFIAGVVDPKNTLDMIVGRPRIILLKSVPTRTQISDVGTLSLELLEPDRTQLAVLGNKVGITVLNLWFTDPRDNRKEVVLSYLVRVLPDPEAKARLVAQYNALAAEVNQAFPQSRIRLTGVGDKVLLSGQAHDVYEAGQIRRVLK